LSLYLRLAADAMDRASARPAAGGAGVALSFDRLIPDGQLRVTKEIIGRGANGIVYVGFLKQPSGEEEPVAVKTLAPGATDEEHGDFFKEFSIMWEASKACPGVAQVHGCSKRGNALCIVMRRYKHSLRDHLEVPLDAPRGTPRQPLPQETALPMLLQIAENVAQLHAANVRVQDLKPANILMDEEGGLYLADFGLAALIVKTITTVQSSMGGTPNYSPPEQLDVDLGPLTEKIDIWALGCLAIELLTGAVPWQGRQPMQIMASVVMKRQSPALPEGVVAPEELRPLLKRCFAFTPAERPAAAELVQAFREMVRAVLPHAAPEPEGGGAAMQAMEKQVGALRLEFEKRFAAQEQTHREQLAQMQAQLDALRAGAEAEKVAVREVVAELVQVCT